MNGNKCEFTPRGRGAEAGRVAAHAAGVADPAEAEHPVEAAA